MPAYFNNTVYYGGVGRVAQGVFDCQRAALVGAGVDERHDVRVSGSHAGHFRERYDERDRLGGGEREPGGAARLRRARPVARALQLEPGAGRPGRVGAGNKFITPTIVNGRVYVGTANGVAVFGLFAPIGPTSLHFS